MSRKQLYQLTCDRCGHEVLSEDHGMEWGEVFALNLGGKQWRTVQRSVVGNRRNGAHVCPTCIDEFFRWWAEKKPPVHNVVELRSQHES